MEPTTPTAAPSQPTGRLRRYLIYAALTIFATIVGALSERYLGVKITLPTPSPLVEQVRTEAESIPVDYEGCHFHGRHDDHDGAGPEAVESNGRPWPVKRITWGFDYTTAKGLNPPLSEDSIRKAASTAWAWWAEGIDVEFVEVDYASAHIPIRFERIDGPSGVLAEAYLADGTTRPKPMRLDLSERWNATGPSSNQVSLPAVMCHEGGHSLGLGHDNMNAPAVMRPTYSASIPREQPRDVERAVALGYPKREVATPPPGGGSGGTATVLTFPVSAKASDMAEALKKVGYKITDPTK